MKDMGSPQSPNLFHQGSQCVEKVGMTPRRCANKVELINDQDNGLPGKCT